MKIHALAAAMLACCAPALADPTRMNMPEGSRDVTVAMLAAWVPRSEGVARHRLIALPLVSVQWANGVFVDKNVVGMHLSDQPDLKYGPILAPTISRITTYSNGERHSSQRFTPEAGAFLKYSVMHGIGLNSSLMYGGSRDHRGLRLELDATLSMPVEAHHSVGLNLGLGLANRSALQADFGVTPEQAGGPLGVHEVKGGVRDYVVGANWHWEIDQKYSLISSLRWQRLHGSAASSPRIEQPDGTSVATILAYHF